MRISSVFFATFDDSEGPRILYQVPEDLITTPHRRGMDAQSPTPVPSDSSNLNTPSIEVEPSSVPDPSLVRSSMDGPTDGQKDSSLRSGKDSRRSNNSSRSKLNASTSSRLNPTKTSSLSPNRTSISQDAQSSKTLFEWDLVSQFVIPRSDVCGRLTISTTKKHRIIGFPVTVRNSEHYHRGSFVFNVCFVFERSVDVRSYESVVRKLARVLTACEIDHQFLSSPSTNHKIYPILEQLFTDLNSFSETSIRIDQFNSIELRIFPRYPNPPNVNAWDVPVPLIDLGNRDKMEGNWDLTMRKVVPFINGVDHVRKIAGKADADIMLVKECMAQVMMYQCVMMIDIFQFSNLYTLCRPVMWLFTDPAIYEECGPYVHKGPGEPLPWSRLAWYYARLKPPLTVGKWINQYDIDLERIDVRRFISFGVIKGFLRRVHRWPILLKDDKLPISSSSIPSKRRNKSINWPGPSHSRSNELDLHESGMSPPDPPPGLSSATGIINLSNSADDRNHRPLPLNPPSLIREDTLKPLDGGFAKIGQRMDKERVGKHVQGGISASIPSSYVSTSVLKNRMNMGGVASFDSAQTQEEEDARALSLPIAQELADQAYNQGHAVAKMKSGAGKTVEIPPDLTELLDGTHHSDELCVHFGLSWNVLHATLSVIGGGTGDDEDLGRVVILYR